MSSLIMLQLHFTYTQYIMYINIIKGGAYINEINIKTLKNILR
jgi:hypothetical protein